MKENKPKLPPLKKPVTEELDKKADIVVIGAGPAALGLVCNAIKTNRYHKLVTSGDGLAILDQGLSFGGGDLQYFGINSNTSARGFVQWTDTSEIGDGDKTSNALSCKCFRDLQ